MYSPGFTSQGLTGGRNFSISAPEWMRPWNSKTILSVSSSCVSRNWCFTCGTTYQLERRGQVTFNLQSPCSSSGCLCSPLISPHDSLPGTHTLCPLFSEEAAALLPLPPLRLLIRIWIWNIFLHYLDLIYLSWLKRLFFFSPGGLHQKPPTPTPLRWTHWWISPYGNSKPSTQPWRGLQDGSAYSFMGLCYLWKSVSTCKYLRKDCFWNNIMELSFLMDRWVGSKGNQMSGAGRTRDMLCLHMCLCVVLTFLCCISCSYC